MLMKLLNRAAATHPWVSSQLASLPLHRLRLGHDFRQWAELLRESRRWSTDQIRQHQFAALQRAVRSAYDGAPFYREYYDHHGFSPRQLRSPEDLHRIPTIDKPLVREHGPRMVVPGAIQGKVREAVTSGTTGQPLKLYVDGRSAQRELASIYEMWGQVDFAPGDWCLELRGVLPGPEAVVALPTERTVRVNVLALRPESLEAIAEALRIQPCRFLHGYPSALEQFSRLVAARDDASRLFSSVEGILIASEVVYPHQVDWIRRAFPWARRFAHYGQAERVALGGWYGASERYHFLPLYSVVERDPDTGCMTGTSLTNEAFPLIRYRLTDVADGFHADPDPKVPHRFPVIDRIGGRVEDTTYRDDGTPVPPAIVTFPFKRGEGILAAKVVQPEIGRIDLQLETATGQRPPGLDEAKIRKDVRWLYGDGTEVRMEYTQRIPRNASGKFRWVECRVPAADRPRELA